MTGVADKRTRATPPKRPTKATTGGEDAGHPVFYVTVDVVILTVVQEVLQVLLIRRKEAPHIRKWALPGGFKRPGETLDEAAIRELLEETGVEAPRHLAQFGTYGDPGRDPRGNIVTVAYLAVTPEVGELTAGTDADDARLWPVAEIVDGDTRLAFDHRQILTDAIEHARSQLEGTDLATAFVGPTFTLTELQSVYEAIWDEPLDSANFRRSLSVSRAAAYVEPTGSKVPPLTVRGRPPELYRATEEWTTGSPVKRPRKRRAPR